MTDNSGGASGSEQIIALSGTGTPVPVPDTALTPGLLNLGSSVLHVVSPAQTITLRNSGNASLAISSAVLSDTADFSVASDTCGTTLSPGASCTYSIVLSPQGVGALTGTLMVTDNAGGVVGSQQSVILNGSGLPMSISQLTLSTVSLSFPATIVKTTAPPQTLTLSNAGGAPLTIGGANLSDNADYTLSSTCRAAVAPGASCALAISFSPQKTGPLSAVLTLTDNSGVSDGAVQQRIELTGTGLPVPAPQASLTPTTGSFGSVSVTSSSAPQSYTLQNTGTATLDISSIALSDPTNFTLSNGCGARIQAGSSCSFSISFQPQKSGIVTATLIITDDSDGLPSSQQTIALTGTGGPLPAPVAVLSTATVSFPDTTVGLSSAVQALTLRNTGNAPLAILGVALSDTKNFSMSALCPASLDPGASCTLSLLFQPQTAGSFQATVTVADNTGATQANVNGPAQQTVSLTANGVAEPMVTLDSSALKFGRTLAGTSAAPQTVTLTNTGSAALHITSTSLSGTEAALFTIVSTSCAGTLPLGGSCSVSVTYSPKFPSAGDTATLVFTDDALGTSGATQTVALTGTASGKVDSVENFGDSITCGFYAQPHDATGLVYSLEGYAGLFDSWLAVPSQNWCRQGDTVADLSRLWVPWNSIPTRADHQLFTLMIGTNDAYRYGIPQSSLQTYTQEVGAALTWLAIPNEDKVLANAITQQTGTWVQDVGFGLKSSDAGAGLTFTVNQPVEGRNLYVVYHVWALPYGQAGQATISVDGVVQATVDESQNAYVNIPTQNGTSDTFLVQTVPLGATGQHTVTFTSAGPSGSTVGLLWAGVPQQSYRNVDGAPRVMVALITNSPSGNQTFAADIYNLQLKSLVPSLSADGMNIDIVATDRVMDTGTDFADILHPNNSGHAKLAAAFEGNR